VLDGKTLYQKSVDVETLCEISVRFLANGKQCTFQGDTALFGINKGSSFRPDWAAEDERRIALTRSGDFVTKYPDAHIAMMTVDKTIDNDTRDFLERIFDIYPQIPHFDAFIKGEGKAKGMRIALEALGLAREDSVAIGDSANDLDMITYAGAGIAVGNACGELKAAARWVSAPCGQGGITRALEYLKLA
jgi:hydroxymethylpyrimidine pyrophosphatase-like HAD family hydrolase